MIVTFVDWWLRDHRLLMRFRAGLPFCEVDASPRRSTVIGR
jgi:hypothetical protein